MLRWSVLFIMLPPLKFPPDVKEAPVSYCIDYSKLIFSVKRSAVYAESKQKEMYRLMKVIPLKRQSSVGPSWLIMEYLEFFS